MGSGLAIQVQLERNTLLPGSLVRGVVIARCESHVDLNSISAVFLTQMTQRWSSGSGKHRRSHVLVTPLAKQAIPLTQGGRISLTAGQQHQFPFAFQLSAGAIPSVQLQAGRSLVVSSTIACEADVRGGFNRSNAQQVIVLSSIPAQVHAQAAPRQAAESHAVDCCGCCFSCGIVSQQVSVDRSVVALDRDRINFNIRVDNTSGKTDIDAVQASLVATTVPKCGNPAVAPSQVMFTTRVPCNAPAGAIGEAQGTLNLNMMAPPSFNSALLDVNYAITLSADTCCCVENSTTILRPITVAHTVDMSGFAAQTQQAYSQAHIVDPNQFAGAMNPNTQNLYFQQQGQPEIPQWQPGMPMAPPPPPQGYNQSPTHPSGGGAGHDPYNSGMAPPPMESQQGYDPNAAPVANMAWGSFAPPPPSIFEQQAGGYNAQQNNQEGGY